MGWKERRFIKKLKKQLKQYSNCSKHYWLGLRCILCGIKVVFEPYKDMSPEEQHKWVIEMQDAIDKLSFKLHGD